MISPNPGENAAAPAGWASEGAGTDSLRQLANTTQDTVRRNTRHVTDAGFIDFTLYSGRFFSMERHLTSVAPD